MPRNQVRIIGGAHRGRRLPVPELPGLRPSGDRIRETLFNWLQPMIAGARCLDLFAGSGALGLEAASRGAGRVVMVDRAVAVVRQLRANVASLQLEQVELVQADVLQWLEQGGEAFDLVFLDPPFDSDLLGRCCERLEAGGWLTANACIYLEDAEGRSLPPLPPSWRVMRDKTAGRVSYRLVRRG